MARIEEVGRNSLDFVQPDLGMQQRSIEWYCNFDSGFTEIFLRIDFRIGLGLVSAADLM